MFLDAEKTGMVTLIKHNKQARNKPSHFRKGFLTHSFQKLLSLPAKTDGLPNCLLLAPAVIIMRCPFSHAVYNTS